MTHFRKGSLAAKQHMARLRAMRGTKRHARKNPLSKTERAFASGHIAAHKEDVQRFGRKKNTGKGSVIPVNALWSARAQAAARKAPVYLYRSKRKGEKGLWKVTFSAMIAREASVGGFHKVSPGGRVGRKRNPSMLILGNKGRARKVRSAHAVCTAAGVRQHTSKFRRCVANVRGKNPTGVPPWMLRNAEFRAAVAQFKRRHGCLPMSVSRVRVPNNYPDFLVAYGRTPEVKYDAPPNSNKGKRIHKFGKSGTKRTMPLLVTSPKAGPKFLAFVGGKFRAKTDWLHD
jgi:hypothetical protein